MVKLTWDQIIRQCPLAKGPFRKELRRCDWCGKKLSGKRRRWCTDRCSNDAAANHYYHRGRLRTLKEGNFTCRGCGKRGAGMTVNHIIPCLGRHSIGSCFHHLSNLEILCKVCHKAETKRQREAGEI